MVGILVMSDFPKVFPNDISELSSERKVKFTIKLIPGTSPILMALYQMVASKLSELKK